MATHTVGLRKRIVTRLGGHTIRAVSAFGVRCTSLEWQEFDSFGTPGEFAGLVPDGELWIADTLLELEGIFFLTNAAAWMAERLRGSTDDAAYECGLSAERALRTAVTGYEFRDGKPFRQVPAEIYHADHGSIPDTDGPLTVKLVDGSVVRSLFKTDFTQGGQGAVYPWVPKSEIWIERDLERREVPVIVAHEYVEFRLMREDDMPYGPAHSIAGQVEFDLRHGRGPTSLLTRGKHFSMRSVHRLADDKFMEYVRDHYKPADEK